MANLLSVRVNGTKVHDIPMFERKEIKVKKIKTFMKTVTTDGVEKDVYDYSLVTIDLSGLNAWIWDRDEENRMFRKVIEEYDITVRNNQDLYEKKMAWYQGYYAELMTNASPNRQLGCFGKVVFSYAPITYEDPATGKTEYGKTRKFYLRDICDAHVTSFKVPMGHVAEFLDAVRKEPQLKVREENQAGNYMEISLDVAECPFKRQGCTNESWMRTTYYPEVHIPNHLRNETPEEAGTTTIRMIAAAVAGLVMKMRHPAWNKPGLYLALGYEPDEIFKYTQDRFQTCQTCLMHKSIGAELRDNSEDGILGQSGIGTQKADGQDPIHFCMFKEQWLRQPWEAQQDMNMSKMRQGSDAGAGTMRRALEASVCEHYMWNYRFNNSGSKRDQGRDYSCKMAFNPWTAASRFVEFRDFKEILAMTYNERYGTTIRSLDEDNPGLDWNAVKIGDEVIVRKSKGGTQLDVKVTIDDTILPYVVSKVPGFDIIKDNLHEKYLSFLRKFGN